MQFRPLLNCFEPDSDHLVRMVQESIIVKPDMTKEYNLSKPVEKVLMKKQMYPDEMEDISFEMETIFKYVKNGFFIEAGASDGEEDSHSLLFEVRHNWTGLLIEPLSDELLLKNRKATIAETCLATQRKAHFVDFDLESTFSVNVDSSSSPNTIRNSMGGIVNVRETCLSCVKSRNNLNF